jgi:hypothetical protein
MKPSGACECFSATKAIGLSRRRDGLDLIACLERDKKRKKVVRQPRRKRHNQS